MAESGGHKPRYVKTNQEYRGRNASKLPKNPLQRLQYRELGGLHRHHRRSVATQVFHKLPGRLGFSLRNMINETVLQEGHVFLGFSKNGQFVLSYTLHVEADEHTSYPVYVYRLQWWQFMPHRRLRKVSEVRLFGEEDIQRDLYIAVCEWPTDDSRILVYGSCALQTGEEKRQCYITITAVPPVEPCWECNQLEILHMHSGYYAGLYDAPPRCLTHSFTVHTKYELAPPYPSFSPKVYLKLDGLLIVNTGDSLIALNVELEENGMVSSLGLYSPRCQRSSSIISTESSSPSEDLTDRCSEPKPLEELDNLDTTLTAAPSLQSPGCSSMHTSRQHPCMLFHSRERHPSAGKENILGSPQPVVNPTLRLETPTKVNRSMDVYAFEGTPTPTKEDSDSGECSDTMTDPPSSNLPPKSVRATLSFTTFHQGARMANDTEEISLYQGDLGDTQASVDLDRPDTPKDLFDRPSHPVRMQPRDLSANAPARSLPSLSIEMLPFGKTLTISPNCGKIDQGDLSSTCSSCVSSPVILQNDTQCFTYSVRRYIETHGVARPDSPSGIEMEDDLSLAYHSVLPVEVHGANYAPMKLLNKQQLQPQTPCIVVKQLTLDIEHYIGETVRTTAEWGHRYLAFTDYDAQIVEVCPDTSEVIALVFVLVRARPPGVYRNKHPKYVPKLYQSGFRLIWNLQTGLYTTLDVDDLVEVNQAELMRKPHSWYPGRRIADSLQRQFAVPQEYSRGVNVLTNEPVFKGQSLKMLLDRHHYVAILL